MRQLIGFPLLTIGLALPASASLAGSASCPSCHDITWAIVDATIEMSGPGADLSLDDAYLVLDDGLATCQLDVNPADIDGPDTPHWDVVLSYGAECGTDLSGALLYIVPTGEISKAFGELL